jgi:dihydroorotase
MSLWQHVVGASRLLDPGSGVDGPGEVWIREGRIAAVRPPGPPPAGGPGPEDVLEVVDAAGCLVTPMFVDLHVHLREPGGEADETIASGCAAALAGGYAVVHAMPNTDPVCDAPQRVEQVLAAAKAAGPVEVVPVSALSRSLEGRALVDLEANAAAGAGAFSDDGAWLADEGLVREALRWAGRNGRVVMQHCEDLGLTGPGVLHECDCVHRAGLPGIPREAEDRAVARDLRLAEEEQAPLHVCHVSTAGAVDAIRRAQAHGLPVTGEATPHHLLLTAEDALEGGTDWKMKPPLRDPADVRAVVEALADGTLAAVATDHAPHREARKANGWRAAPFGAIGLETAFAVLYTRLVVPGALPVGRLVEALTSGPCAVVDREAPRLAPGAPARLNFLDVQTERRVDRESLASRSHNCPFHGASLRGWPVASLVGTRLWRQDVASAVRIRTEPPEGDDPDASRTTSRST